MLRKRNFRSFCVLAWPVLVDIAKRPISAYTAPVCWLQPKNEYRPMTVAFYESYVNKLRIKYIELLYDSHILIVIMAYVVVFVAY